LPASSPVVLQFISSAGFYGAERVLLELALHLREGGWDSRIGVFKHGNAPVALADEARRQGLTVVEFPCHGQFDRALPRALADYAAREHVALIHSHGYKSDIYLRWAPLPPTTRRVATCHNWLTGGMKLALYQWLDLRALRRFERVVAVSEPVLARARQGGVAPARSLIIPNGIAHQPPAGEAVAAVRAEFAADPTERLVLQIGRLSAEKGNDLLLRAFARAQGNSDAAMARLVFAGDGPERPALENLAQSLGLLAPDALGRPRVIFAGYRTDVPALLAAADLFVISSHYEGLPTVLLEAMAAGKMIIATAVGMIPQVLNHGEAGVLIPPGDEAALAQALAAALAPSAHAEGLGQAAQRRYAAAHSRAAMGVQYEALYLSLF
jgi:glycosyltransferase involved in cell wall biosynthesis